MKASLVLPIVLALSPGVALAETVQTMTLDLGGARTSFVRLPPGQFVMGSASTDPGHKDDEVAHTVTFSSGFYMQTTPVTVGVWKRFVDATGYRSEAEKGTSGGFGWNGSALVQAASYTWKNPGFAQTDEHPVTIITYDDALEFSRWATRLTGRSMTLPTEAQWEYAYRAGTTSTYYDATAKDPLGLGWFKDNAGQGTKPVSQKKPNAWGLFDMGGNVWQWCLDWYAPYSPADATDPMQNVADASDKPRRVLRGGSWLKDAKNGRAAARFRSAPGTRNADTGFRLVILDKTPDLAVTTPPAADPTPANNPPPQNAMTEPSTQDSGGSGWFRFLFALPAIGMFLFIAKKIFEGFTSSNGSSRGGGGRTTSGISLRPGKDGFWIHSNPSHVGSQVAVKYRSGGTVRVAHATVERTTSGQFVYTGYAPENLELQDVIVATQANNDSSQWSSNQSSSYHHSQHVHDSYSSSSNDSSFQGYPPAY